MLYNAIQSENAGAQLVTGDCVEKLRDLEDASVIRIRYRPGWYLTNEGMTEAGLRPQSMVDVTGKVSQAAKVESQTDDGLAASHPVVSLPGEWQEVSPEDDPYFPRFDEDEE